MKKVINNPEVVVEEMLQGMVYAYPQYIKKLDNANVLVRKNAKADKVALISGGGSGHEPSHGGFVGKGMLDGAVAGAVFTSPTPDQIYEAIKAVANDAGVLLVVKNYTGDVMNFDMAKEMAELEGITVDSVIVNDDVAVQNSTWTIGRRGIAGTVFIHKIAGAKAETGASLLEVKAVAEKVIANVRSMGMALTPCIVPAAGKPNFTLAENEMEVGMGIHGEPGTHREELKPADEIVAHLMDRILTDMNPEENCEVAVMINGLGATPLMEQFIVNKKVNEILNEKGVKVYKTLVGEFMTSIEMAGFSITLLKLDNELKELLDAPADTPAFRQI
jgi:dihydroxyacetone kinase-like protein